MESGIGERVEVGEGEREKNRGGRKEEFLRGEEGSRGRSGGRGEEEVGVEGGGEEEGGEEKE
jgi:hypothetical protein